MNCSTPASLSCTISQMWNLAGLMLEFQQSLQRVPGEVAGLSQELGAAADVTAGTQNSRGEGGGCHRVTKDPEPMRCTLNTPKKGAWGDRQGESGQGSGIPEIQAKGWIREIIFSDSFSYCDSQAWWLRPIGHKTIIEDVQQSRPPDKVIHWGELFQTSTRLTRKAFACPLYIRSLGNLRDTVVESWF